MDQRIDRESVGVFGAHRVIARRTLEARAADGGYVRNLEDKRGKPGRWIVGDPLPEAADLLPDPAQLCNTAQSPDQDRCGVAAGSDGERAEVATPDCAGVWTDCANTNCRVFAACVLADTAVSA